MFCLAFSTFLPRDLHGEDEERNRMKEKKGHIYCEAWDIRGKRWEYTVVVDRCCGIELDRIADFGVVVRGTDAREQIHALSVLRLALGDIWRWVSFYLSLLATIL